MLLPLHQLSLLLIMLLPHITDTKPTAPPPTVHTSDHAAVPITDTNPTAPPPTVFTSDHAAAPYH